MVRIPLEAAYTAGKKKDHPEAFRLFLQAQALRNDPNVEKNIKNLRDNGVVPMEPGLTRPIFPIGPSDKADALFKLRVEKAFSEQPAIGLQQLKEKSAFVFDAGRVMNPAALPEVNEPPGKFVEKAIALAKAALILPRSAIERPDAPSAVKDNPMLKKITEQQDAAVTRLDRALKVRRGIFLEGNKADAKEVKANVDEISRAANAAAFAAWKARNAAGSETRKEKTVQIVDVTGNGPAGGK